MVSLPTSVLAVTLIVNVIKLFDLIYVMTFGGPGKASRVIAFTMYQQAFSAGQYGYGSAGAGGMLGRVLPLIIFHLRRLTPKAGTRGAPPRRSPAPRPRAPPRRRAPVAT